MPYLAWLNILCLSYWPRCEVYVGLAIDLLFVPDLVSIVRMNLDYIKLMYVRALAFISRVHIISVSGLV